MKIIQIFALIICTILIALCGTTAAGENKLVNIEVPLPGDTKIVAPAEDIPKKIAEFSGVWEGKWTYPSADAALVVEEINSKEAKVIYCKGKPDHYTTPASCERYKAIVRPEKPEIEFSQGNKNWIFNLENSLNQIKGTHNTPLGSFEIIMTKIK